MRISWSSVLVALLATESAVASSWFSKAVYNKWHETELERWLSDHDVPYPTPADRKDLQDLVKSNWQAAVESPYLNWDTKRLQKQLEVQGQDLSKRAEQNKDALVSQVKGAWIETSDSANDAYSSAKDWIFDSWSDSQLKSFCDYHHIPVPQPRQRDQLLSAARSNYATAASKLSEATSYPGNWLYEKWSDSELKSFLDSHGIPAPQPSSRDKLIATVRRNSRVASLNTQALAKKAENSASSVMAEASSAKGILDDKALESWSDSQIKAFCDKHAIPVPQGSSRNELIALARKHSHKLSVSADSAASVLGAATSSAGNEYAKATEDSKLKAGDTGNMIYSQVMHYYTEAQYAIGLKTNAASEASKSAATASKSISSAYTEASRSAHGEL